MSRSPIARNPRVVPVRRSAAGLLLAGCLLAGGCGGPAAGAAADPTGEWELVELVRNSTVEQAPVGGRATMTVADGTIGGSGYCNEYGTGYRLDGDRIELDGVGGTERGCAPELMAADTVYFEALASVDTVASRDGYLVLTGPGVELRFRPVAPVPTSDLAGTEWVLETLLDGEVAASTTGEPARLRLTTDGTLTASTGCRDATASWEPDGDIVRVTGFAGGPGGCPADVADQDRQVTRVLSGPFRVAVAGGSLTVTGPDGLGLVYRDEGA